MDPADEAALVSIALVPAVFCLLFFLRHRFPNASTTSKTVVILIVTVIFLLICSMFPESDSRGAGKNEQVIPRASVHGGLAAH